MSSEQRCECLSWPYDMWICINIFKRYRIETLKKQSNNPLMFNSRVNIPLKSAVVNEALRPGMFYLLSHCSVKDVSGPRRNFPP